MADADFRSTTVEDRGIALGHLLFGADPGVPNLAAAASANTLAAVILRIFENPPAVADLGSDPLYMGAASRCNTTRAPHTARRG